jgi:hypothetical protein
MSDIADQIRAFIDQHPGMALRPAGGGALNLVGTFRFTATSDRYPTITDAFQLQISIPPAFPRELPQVYETGGRIPKGGEYHVNPDGSLCLGSRLRLLWKLSKDPSLLGYAENCIVPYLFAISHKLTYGGPLPFGELAHGPRGEISDCAELFRVKSAYQVQMVIRYLAMKKRRANKLPCPCLCGRRLGKCQFNHRLRDFRIIASRSWFRSLKLD